MPPSRREAGPHRRPGRFDEPHRHVVTQRLGSEERGQRTAGHRGREQHAIVTNRRRARALPGRVPGQRAASGSASPRTTTTGRDGEGREPLERRGGARRSGPCARVSGPTRSASARDRGRRRSGPRRPAVQDSDAGQRVRAWPRSRPMRSRRPWRSPRGPSRRGRGRRRRPSTVTHAHTRKSTPTTPASSSGRDLDRGTSYARLSREHRKDDADEDGVGARVGAVVGARRVAAGMEEHRHGDHRRDATHCGNDQQRPGRAEHAEQRRAPRSARPGRTAPRPRATTCGAAATATANASK